MDRWLVFYSLALATGASALLAPSPPLRHSMITREFGKFQYYHPTIRPSSLLSTYYDDFDDFITQPIASPTESDPLLNALRNRQQQLEEEQHRLPLIVLDTMLPRQVLDVQLSHPTLKDLIRYRLVETDRPTLGMLGMVKTPRGFVPLSNGVEVEIVECEQANDIPGDTLGGSEDAWDVSLKAKRRFSLAGNVTKNERGWTESRVGYLDSKIEEETQQKESEQQRGEEGSTLSLARAISKSRQFTQPNINIPNNLSIIERWIELARENERHPSQIDKLLDQLGEFPPEDQPSERAFWVGALINPLPALGVALEIRPSLLMAKSAEDRVDVALGGIWGSIKHMDGSSKLW